MTAGVTLRDKRVLVVGASSGIGRAFAGAALGHGARVVLAARRADLLEEAVAGHDHARGVAADVREQEDCARLLAEAAAELGGLDLLLYSVGAAPLARVEDLDAAAWRGVMETNVIGASLVTAAALPHLADGAVCAYVSSISANRPYWGLAAYTTSKAALNQLAAAWRAEHPRVRFTRIVMGNTAPTGFGDAFDRDVLEQAFPHWNADGIRPFDLMEAADVGTHLAESLAVALAHPGIELQELRLEAPRPREGG